MYIWIYACIYIYMQIYMYIYVYNIYIYIYVQFHVTLYMYVRFTAERFEHMNHWISVSYQVMSSIHTQSQLSTATPISSFDYDSCFISTTACIIRHIYFNLKTA